jgi:uncharacterized protein YbjT (DUF2867 family)
MHDGLVVVTGAGGFIGRELCAHFARTGRRFRAIVREHGPVTALPHAHYAVADLAVTPEDELDALLGGATAVAHLAGRAHAARDSGDPSPRIVRRT